RAGGPRREKPVPQGAAKGDYVTKTQPFSDLSFRPKKDLTGADMWGATMFDHELVVRAGKNQYRRALPKVITLPKPSPSPI
ncbi:hypothetical protein CKQ90_33595, partial [Klebsiella pneumoniae]